MLTPEEIKQIQNDPDNVMPVADVPKEVRQAQTVTRIRKNIGDRQIIRMVPPKEPEIQTTDEQAIIDLLELADERLAEIASLKAERDAAAFHLSVSVDLIKSKNEELEALKKELTTLREISGRIPHLEHLLSASHATSGQ